MANLIFHKRMSIAQYNTFKTQHTVNGVLDDEFKNTLFVLNETGTFTGTDDCIFYMGEHLISYASYKKTLSLTSQSTDNEFPTAKCVYDAIENAISGIEGGATLTPIDDGIIIDENNNISLSNVTRYDEEIMTIPEFNPVKLDYVDLSMQDILGFHRLTRETANCYIINSLGYYMFPLVYGCGIKDGAINSGAYTNNGGTRQAAFVNYKGNQITSPYIEIDTGETAETARIEISDSNNVINNIDLKTDVIENIKFLCFKVISIPETGGNVILSILDENDNIMWSWHIWLWDQVNHPLSNVEIENYSGNTYRILNYNLATKLDSDLTHMKNWYYQWGRKDPMLLPSAYNNSANHTSYGNTSFSISSIASSVSDAIKNPCTFYKRDGSNYNYNWVQLNSFFNYWDATCNSTGYNEKIITKTIYDPCPPGYTIPNARVFTGFTTTGNNTNTSSEFNVNGSWKAGWNFKDASDNSVFFPASGCRYYDSGAVYDIGSGGSYWSAGAFSVSRASDLGFGSGRVYPLLDYNRASGFSVRPVFAS